MAAPTITSVTPNVGRTSGRVLVTILGTGFAPAHVPPVVQGKTPAPNPSVQVLFGDVPALRAEPVSSTELLVLVPVHDPGTVSITVKNLNADGLPITGESATKATAYTFKRPDLTVESSITRVTRALRRDLARQVLENTVITTHTDYSDDGAAARITALAKLPGIVLHGPTLRENRFYDSNVADEVDLPGDLTGLQRPKYTCDLTFTLVGAAESEQEMINLSAIVADYFTANTHLSVARDPNDASKGTVEFELAFDDATLRVASIENASNVRHFTTEVAVVGVWVEAEDMVVDKVAPMQDYVPPTGLVEPASRADITWTIKQYLPPQE